jgi:hypothetical protein
MHQAGRMSADRRTMGLDRCFPGHRTAGVVLSGVINYVISVRGKPQHEQHREKHR